MQSLKQKDEGTEGTVCQFGAEKNLERLYNEWTITTGDKGMDRIHEFKCLLDMLLYYM